MKFGEVSDEEARARIAHLVANPQLMGPHMTAALIQGSLPQSDVLRVGDVAPPLKVFSSVDGAPLEDLASAQQDPNQLLVEGLCKAAAARLPLRLISVYIVEAHPLDGWGLSENDEQGVCYRQPTTLEERVALAKVARESLGLESEVVVDGMDNATELAYEARPERLYVLQAGKVLFRSGIGPYQYSPAKLEAFLAARQ